MSCEGKKCTQCNKGDLIPLSDYTQPKVLNNVPIPSVAMEYKMWACTNPDCRSFIVIRGGNVYYGQGKKL